MKRYINLPCKKQGKGMKLKFCWGIGNIYTTEKGKRLHLRYFEQTLHQEVGVLVCIAGCLVSLKALKKAVIGVFLQLTKSLITENRE